MPQLKSSPVQLS